MQQDTLKIYTICYNTSDFPGLYTCRIHEINGGKVEVGPLMGTGQTLEEVRKLLPIGVHNIQREPDDDPVIIESWI